MRKPNLPLARAKASAPTFPILQRGPFFFGDPNRSRAPADAFSDFPAGTRVTIIDRVIRPIAESDGRRDLFPPDIVAMFQRN